MLHFQFTLSTALILIPAIGALGVFVYPDETRIGNLKIGVAALALLVALVEVGVWVLTLRRYDFGNQQVIQLHQTHVWFKDLGVSYDVGIWGPAIWLIGLAVVVMAAAIGYAYWSGRDRTNAYYGLMLLLTSAIVGVFLAQDLLLFYAFFEAMLIPLYVLVGVWGGAGRLRATLKFVVYTMVGSLLMLAAILVYGLGQGTFSMIGLYAHQSDSTWLFLGFMVAFAIKAPLFPFHGWLPDAYREAPPEVTAILSGVIAKAGLYGMLRIAIPLFTDPTGPNGPADFYRTPILVLAAIALV